jgi:hypothetical protein
MQRTLIKILFLLPFAGSAVLAQEPGNEIREEENRTTEVADTEPGISAEDIAAEREAIEPAVPTTVVAQDVRRTAVGSGVMDEIELARTEITGNQELPKVLYIVPWQKSDPGDLTGKPVNTLLDEVLAPIDRSEFIRQVEYYGDLYGNDEE